MPKAILEFIIDCITNRRVHWTYHINLRLEHRFIPRKYILSAVDTYEIIESYPRDKYLPSYLIYSEYEAEVFHILVAVDRENNNVRIITAYRPDKEKWENDFKTRRKK